MCPQSMFRAKIRKNRRNNSIENFQFLQLEKNLNITWACILNVIRNIARPVVMNGDKICPDLTTI